MSGMDRRAALFHVTSPRNVGHGSAGFIIQSPYTSSSQPAARQQASPPRRERGERKALRELRLPCDPLVGLCIVDPLPSSLLLLEPVLIEGGDVELVEVVC